VGQLAININGRSYQIACEEGQEQHLSELGAYIDKRVKDLVSSVGQIGDTRLLVMASLLIADELSDLYDELDTLRGQGRSPPSPPAAGGNGAALEAEAAEQLESAARAIEDIAARLERV
jgi:cell division protein ZapA